MKKILLLLSIFFLQITQSMQKTENHPPFKITVDAEKGSVKKNAKRPPIELKLGYDFLNREPDEIKVGNYLNSTQAHLPPSSNETEQSQLDI